MEYTTVKIPKELALTIDTIIKNHALGFKNRTDFTIHCLRIKIAELKEGPADDQVRELLQEKNIAIFCPHCNSAIWPEEANTEHCPHCGEILEGE